MNKYECVTCEDTGKVPVANGPDDYDIVACPDCPLGLAIMEKEMVDMDDNSDKPLYEESKER